MSEKRTMNLLLEGVDSIRGYQTEILDSIFKKTKIQYCVCTVKDHDGKDYYDENRVTAIDYDLCEHNRYAEICDMNNLLPLDRKIMEAMLPYESCAIRMLVRNTEQDIYFYDECKRLYYAHLRFWNHIFLNKKITHVFQICVPHHVHDYIIYALAKIYGCKYQVNVASSIWNHWIPSDNLEIACTSLVEHYKEIENYEGEVNLSDKIEHYYHALQFNGKDIDQNIMNAGKSRKQHIDIQRKRYLYYFNRTNRLKRKKHLLKERLQAIRKHDKKLAEIAKDESTWNRNLYKRAQLRTRLLRDIKYYDSLASFPVEGEKYVVFFLHFQPEATTLPQAGVFVEQEQAIFLLAHALQKKGIHLYVKEHFVQPYRTKVFYDTLGGIENVTLMKSDIDSKQLTMNSFAVASCCGSAIQEAIFNGIPALLFGFGIFNGAPGTFYCSSEADIDTAICCIQDGLTIDQKKVRLYLKAIDDVAVRTETYVANYPDIEDLHEKCGFDDLINEIIIFLQ